MKLIYAQGFSKAEKLECRTIVLQNVIQSMRLIFDAMEDYSIEFEKKENEVSLEPPAQAKRGGALPMLLAQQTHGE